MGAVPTTIVGIVALLLIALPGALFEWLRDKSRPGRSESAFVETIRVISSGALISIITVIVIGSLSAFARSTIVDYRRALLDSTYIPNNLPQAAFSLLLFLTISSMISLLAFSLLPYPGTRVVAQESAWVTAFGRIVDKLAIQSGKAIEVQVQVQLKGGEAWIGTKDAYSSDPEIEGRELILRPPLFRISEGRPRNIDPGWERLVIHGSSIESILIRYSEGVGSNFHAGARRRVWTRDAIPWLTDRPLVVGLLLVTILVAPILVDHLL